MIISQQFGSIRSISFCVLFSIVSNFKTQIQCNAKTAVIYKVIVVLLTFQYISIVYIVRIKTERVMSVSHHMTSD